MAAFSKVSLDNASNDWRGIEIQNTSTTFHTAHATAIDEVWAWCSNVDTADKILTIEWGGTTVPDDNMTFTVPASSTILVVPGLCASGSLVLAGKAAAAGDLTIFGFVNRLT